MSKAGMSFDSKVFDAAQLLLDRIKSNIRESTNERNDYKECEEAAQLFLSCFLASNVAQQPIKAITSHKVGTVGPIYADAKSTTRKSNVAIMHSPKRKIPDQGLTSARHNHTYHFEEFSNKRSQIFKRKPIKHFTVTSGRVPSFVSSRDSNSAKKDNVSKVSVTKIKTRDVGTQIEENQLPIIETMALTISQYCEKIKSLEQQIKSKSQLVETIDHDVFGNDNDDEDESFKVNSNEMTTDDSDAFDSEMDNTFNNRETPEKVKTKHRAGQCNENPTKVLSNRNVNANADDLVPIGNGNALIPSRIFRHVNWNSYTCATRKLLTAVFPRRILATHSLTGKPSPAFPNKPAKKKLDPALVSDIVQTVVDRCCVPENVVRTVITLKCADESKIFRTRENIKKKRMHQVNENIPPETIITLKCADESKMFRTRENHKKKRNHQVNVTIPLIPINFNNSIIL